MNILLITGIGITAAAISVVLRHTNKEYGLLISLSVSVLILGIVIGALEPVISFLNSLYEMSDIKNEYIGILMKALSVGYLSQFASDCCRDSGETAIASKIDFAGKIALLIITIPLFEAILKIIKEIII